VPKVQTWIAENVFVICPTIAMHHKAVLVSEAIFPQVRIEQHLDAVGATYFISQIFQDRTEAYAWLSAQTKATPRGRG
jgi:hypothetical protein